MSHMSHAMHITYMNSLFYGEKERDYMYDSMIATNQLNPHKKTSSAW